MDGYTAQAIVSSLNALRLEIRAASFRVRLALGDSNDREAWRELFDIQDEADRFANNAEALLGAKERHEENLSSSEVAG